MARRLVLVVSCNVCEEEIDESDTFLIRMGANKHDVDLCKAHRAEFDEMMARFLGEARQSRKATPEAPPKPIRKMAQFQCPFCPRAVSKQNMAGHVLSKHGGKSFDLEALERVNV